MKPIKLLIFDLDGTLADTIEGITEGINRVMTAEGYPTHTRESVLGFVNYGVRQYIEEALPLDVRGDYDTVTRLMGEYNKHYADTYTTYYVYPVPGCPFDPTGHPITAYRNEWFIHYWIESMEEDGHTTWGYYFEKVDSAYNDKTEGFIPMT